MLNLEKALIPKPKKIEANGKFVKLTSFNLPLFEIKRTSEDERVIEGEKFILAKMKKLAPISEGAGKYEILIKVDGNDERFSDIDSEEAYYV